MKYYLLEKISNQETGEGFKKLGEFDNLSRAVRVSIEKTIKNPGIGLSIMREVKWEVKEE